MSKIFSHETIDPHALAEEERRALLCRLYKVHRRIFDGLEKDEFEEMIIRPSAKWTRLRIFANAKRQDVGFCAVHLFEVVLGPKHLGVFRVEAGICRDFRGEGQALRFCFQEILRHKLHHPFEETYLFCTLLHPSSYRLVAKYFYSCYPHPAVRTPEGVSSLMEELAEAFGEKPAEGGGASIRQTGAMTRDTAEETALWEGSGEQAVRFFLEKNPGYGRGHGLVTLVPLSPGNMLRTGGGYLWKVALLKWGRMTKGGAALS